MYRKLHLAPPQKHAHLATKQCCCGGPVATPTGAVLLQQQGCNEPTASIRRSPHTHID